MHRDISCHSSRRQLRAWPGGGVGGVRSWTGNLLSTPLASNFGPGQEAAAEGRATARGTCFLRLSPPTLDQARMGRRGGAQLDAEFAFHAPRSQLRAWPGWGCGGVRCLGVEFAFLSFTHWPLDGRPRYAWSLIPTPSKTVDQTLPPSLMG